MALVPFLDREQVPSDRGVHPFDTVRRVVGSVLKFHRVVGHSPRALEAYATLSVALKEMRLDRKLRELAYLRTAQLNRCQY